MPGCLCCDGIGLSGRSGTVRYSSLLTLLKVTPYGTPGKNLNHLVQLGVSVTYAEGSIAGLRELVAHGTPCVVLVRTLDLPYWSIATDHAVVVVGYGPEHIYLNDPAFATHPHTATFDRFELAWMALDYRYAVIRRG